MKWGPFRLNSNNLKSTHKVSRQSDARPHKPVRNDDKRYELVDVNELDELEHKPDSNNPTIPEETSTDDVVHYTQWSSRKFQHKQLAAPLNPIVISQLPSLSPSMGNATVYDVVIIVTSAEHVATRLQNRRPSATKNNNFDLISTTDMNNSDSANKPPATVLSTSPTPTIPAVLSTSQAKTMRDAHKTHSTWLTRQSPRKVLPTRAHSMHATSPTLASNSTSGIKNDNNNHAYQGIPPVDLADNPHTEAYQRQHSSKLNTYDDDNASSNVDSDSSIPVRRASRTKSTAIVSTGGNGGVEREAFFFRVNHDSYNKRHTANTSTTTQNQSSTIYNTSAEAGAKDKTNKQHRHRGQSADVPSSSCMVTVEKGISNSASESVLEDFASTRVAEKAYSFVYTSGANAESRVPRIRHAQKSNIFMRSKGITLDLTLQLFQVPSGVYSRLTLYGMENFIPETSVSSANAHRTSTESSPNTSAEARAGNASSAETTAVDPSSDCIICLTNKQNTIMFPCRHLCLCAECASILATQSGNMENNYDHQPQAQEKKCPVCRKPVVLMFQLKP